MAKPAGSPTPTDGRLGGRHIHYDYKIYVDLIEPDGALSIRKESHACWFYTQSAMRSLAAWNGGIDGQIIQYRVGDEVPDWIETRFEEIAKSTALIYGLESPDEFLKDEWKKRVWAQATQLGLEVDLRIYDVRPGVKRLT